MREREIRIIGVPIDLGAGRRGVDMGPSGMRKAGLASQLAALGHRVVDGGNIPVDEPETQRVSNPKLRYLEEIARAMTLLAERVEIALDEGALPLVAGGDHSIAIGSIAGVAAHHKKHNARFGMVWFDAHGDANTEETTPSGNIHGMSQAIGFGRGAAELCTIGGFEADEAKLSPANSTLVGARDLDEKEKTVLRDIGFQIVTMTEIDRRGIYDVMQGAIGRATDGTEGFHVSFDLDSMDPKVAPGVGTPVPGGLTYRETHAAMEMLAETEKVVSVEIAEVNPILDVRNTTSEIAVEMILSCLGRKIL